MVEHGRPLWVRLSALSGAGWALIAWFIGYRVFGSQLWGGILIAPLIGILIGWLCRPLRDKAPWLQGAGSLVLLYLAAATFALGIGLTQVLFAPRHTAWSAALFTPVFAVLWGLTFGAYALILWPLAYLNQRLLWDASAGTRSPAPALSLTPEAVRNLAVRLMALVAVGYFVWSVFQASLWALGYSTARMPWWVSTDLMRWSAWFVLACLVWLLAPALAWGAARAAGGGRPSTATYGELLGVVGFAVIVFPLLSFPAHLAVMALKISLVASWPTEGQVLRDARYYGNVMWSGVPWVVAGGAMLGARRLIARHEQQPEPRR